MKNSDKPAFATASPETKGYDSYLQEGLTKREYFAGLILQGIMSAGVKLEANYMNHFAQVAIMQADALLAELELSNRPTGTNDEQ